MLVDLVEGFSDLNNMVLFRSFNNTAAAIAAAFKFGFFLLLVPVEVLLAIENKSGACLLSSLIRILNFTNGRPMAFILKIIFFFLQRRTHSCETNFLMLLITGFLIDFVRSAVRAT